MIDDALAIIQFFQNLSREHAADRDQAESDRLRVSQLSQALTHEIREALNLVELAASAHEKRESSLRDHLVRSIRLPLLEAMACGLYGEDLGPDAARRLLERIPLESEGNAEMLDDADDGTQVLKSSSLASRVVARVESMKVLAAYNREITWVRWAPRLQLVKRALVEMLKRVVEAEDRSFAKSA